MHFFLQTKKGREENCKKYELMPQIYIRRAKKSIKEWRENTYLFAVVALEPIAEWTLAVVPHSVANWSIAESPDAHQTVTSPN